MKSPEKSESPEIEVRRLRYLEYLSELFREGYYLLKKTRRTHQYHKYYIEGFMKAGRFFGVKNDEMEALMEKANYEVFGMSIEERKKIVKEIPVQEPMQENSEYDIPTYIRKRKRLSI